MYRVSARKLTGHHLLVTTNNRTNVFKIGMGQTEAVLVIVQWNLVVVYPTARMADANAIGDNN